MATRRRSVVPLSRANAAACRKALGAVPTTDALALLPADASESDWLAARRSTVGASEIAAVLGCSPYTSAFALWWRKKMAWDLDATESMMMGRRLEAVIGEVFAETLPELFVARPNAALYGHPQWPALSCTPDFVAVQKVTDSAGQDRLTIRPVECKSDQGGQGWGEPGTDEVPLHHKHQIWQQCEILNSGGGYLPRLNGKRFTWYYVPYTKDDQARMRGEWAPRALEFLDSIDAGETPPLDGSPSTTEVLERLHADMDPEAVATIPMELADALRRAHALREVAKEGYDHVTNEVRQMMGNARYAVDPDGKRVMRRDIYKRREFIMPATTVDRVVPL
jgi:predicted phage-related endonuclease